MKNISPKARVASTAIIQDGVTIEDDVIVHDYVTIYPNTVVKKGTEIFEHCVLGKCPASPGTTARALKETYSTLVVGEGCILNPGVVLYAGSVIGDRNLLGDYCSIREECSTGAETIIGRHVCVNYNTEIGHNTKIMDSAIITGNMKIGNHVFISMHVTTSNDNTMGREAYSEDHINGAVIDDYVTIGAAANILPGVHIGENALVGASALVTKDVPASKVVMGIPARVIRDV